MRKNPKKKRMKTGASLALLLLLAALIPGLLVAGKDDKAEAVIAGTVFRDPGFAFPGVEITLSVVTPPPGKKKAQKPRKLAADPRGEFAFRVPAGAAKYKLSAAAEGFKTEEKEVVVNLDERVDVYFTLKPVGQ